jgi:hypothetical protein
MSTHLLNQVGKEIALSMMQVLRSLSGDAGGGAAGKASGGTMITTIDETSQPKQDGRARR